MQDPSVQEEGQPQAVELVRHLRIEERQEATDIVHAVHLRAECGLLMEVAPHEVTVLPGGDLTPALGADAARPACYDTIHVRVVSVVPRAAFGADRPLGDIFWPLVGILRGRLVTYPGVLVADRTKLSLVACKVWGTRMNGPLHPHRQRGRALLLGSLHTPRPIIAYTASRVLFTLPGSQDEAVHLWVLTHAG